MKKFKRLLLVLGMCVSALCLALGLTACDFGAGDNADGGDSANQNQGNGDNQGSDENQGGIPEKTTPVEGSTGLKYTLSEDGTYYVCSGIGTCTETEIVIGNTHNEYRSCCVRGL